MKRILLVLFLGFGMLRAARAETPLLLETTIQLPTSGGWDFQHWMSDSTFGWACLGHDTIYYCLELGDSVQSFIIPDSIFSGYGTSGTHGVVKLVRSVQDPNNAAVFLVSRIRTGDYWSYQYYDVFSIFDLTTPRLVSRYVTGGGYDYWPESGPRQYLLAGYPSTIPWPALPAATLSVDLARTWHYQYDGLNDFHRARDYGDVMHFDTQALPLIPLIVDSAVSISNFAGSNPPCFAANGLRNQSEWYTGYPATGTYFYWLNTYCPATGLSSRDTLSGICEILAQQDATGTRRIILFLPPRLQALEPQTYNVLWQDSDGYADPWVARLAGDSDERVLSFDSRVQCFHVLDASTGVILDETTPVVGGVAFVIRSEEGPSKIVTRYVNTVRIYGSCEPSPGMLTLNYITASNVVRLDWAEVSCAIQYYVYSSSQPGIIDVLEGTVPAGTHSFELTPQDVRRFYCVTAEYSAR